MKHVKNIVCISTGIVLVALVIGCNSPFFGLKQQADGSVIIKLAGSNSRTIMPKEPKFDRFDIILQQGETVQTLEDVIGIAGGGVVVGLREGLWNITLKAYKDL